MDEVQLSETDQEELEKALSEIREGRYTDGSELLRELQGLSSVHGGGRLTDPT